MSIEKWLFYYYGKNADPQKFGEDPIKIRDSNHYVDEYIWDFVNKWDLLINWKSRAENESQFIIKELNKRQVNYVFDAATGTGFDSIQLIKAGFDVTSLDGCLTMLTKAKENAKKYGCKLKTIHSDWKLMHLSIKKKFDAVICLGNSFAHLFTKKDQGDTLSEFYKILNADGVLIVDHLNFNKIYGRRFPINTRYCYSSGSFLVRAEHIDEGLARLSYQFPDNDKFYLNLFPINKDFLKNLILQTGFEKLKIVGDYNEIYNKDTDYFIHIAEKVQNALTKI